MARVIMTSDEYIQRLEKIVARNNFYSNKYAFNLGMICPPKSVTTFKCIDGITRTNLNPTEQVATSADCWNLIKAVLNGYDVNNMTIGYFQKDLSNTGDVTGDVLMQMCTDVSADFTKLVDGVPELLYMSGHAGSFIGLRTFDGHTYNVIESTGSWGRKILYSWVDPDGTRRRWKGGEKNGKWAKHGKMTPWVSYGATPTPIPTPTPTVIKVKVNCELPIIKVGSKGKDVKVWQTIVGVTADGDFGPNTKAATIKFQKSVNIAQDGIVGKDSWTAGLNSL